MKNLICMFMIVMTITIFFKYDKNLGAKQSIKVEKVKIADNGALFCMDNTCGENDTGWDGFVPFEQIIMLEESSSRDKAKEADKFKKEDKY